MAVLVTSHWSLVTRLTFSILPANFFAHGSGTILRKLDSPVHDSNIGFWFKIIPSYPDMHRRMTDQRRNKCSAAKEDQETAESTGRFVCKNH